MPSWFAVVLHFDFLSSRRAVHFDSKLAVCTMLDVDRRFLWYFSAFFLLCIIVRQQSHDSYYYHLRHYQTTTLKSTTTTAPKSQLSTKSVKDVSSTLGSPILDKLLGSRGAEPLVKFSFPSIEDFVPNYPNLHLQFHLQSDNITTKAKIVFGILMQRKAYRHYLINILRDLIVYTDENERESLLVVVFVTRDCHYLVQKVVDDIKEGFLYDGLIEVISVTEEGYPAEGEKKDNFDHLMRGVGRKVNVDIAYMMAYARLRGHYLVQLEDDAHVNQNMMVHSIEQSIEAVGQRSNQSWFLLDFATKLKFSGKMFKTSDLHYIIQQLVMFREDKTYHWLLEDVMIAKFCAQFIFWIRCGNGDRNSIWVKNIPQLFEESEMSKITEQKIAAAAKIEAEIKNSTLEEKTEKLLTQKIAFKSTNSSIKHFKDHSFERLMNGSDFFWGQSPQKGEYLSLLFQEPQNISTFAFSSGHPAAKEDIFKDAVVEIQPLAIDKFILDPNITFTADSFTTIGKFDKNGSCAGEVPKKFWPIVGIRVRIVEDNMKWVLLHTIKLEQKI